MKTIHVAKRCKHIVICLIVLFAWAGKSWSADLPQNVGDGLQRHELNLQQTTFVWHLNDETRHAGMRPDAITSNQKQLEKSYADKYRSTGMTDEAQIRKLVQQNINLFTKAVGHSTTSYSSPWRFVRDHQLLLISGAVQHTSTVTDEYRQFYDGPTAMLVEDSDQTRATGPQSLSAPIIWRTSGESVRNFAPVVQGLNVLPEHLTMLTGLNPLAMHGTQWKLTSTTPDNWTLKAHVEQEDTPIDIQLTLDRKHDDLPLMIQMTTARRSDTFIAESFRRYRDSWVCDRVLYRKSIPGVVSAVQHWDLRSLETSNPVVVNLPPGVRVHDYRLMGQDLRQQDVMRADTRNNKRLVYYSWSGHFLSLDELKQVYQKQHPGEAAPDPNYSTSTSPGALGVTSSMVGSFLPVAGGILCVGGGIWMFKHRRSE